MKIFWQQHNCAKIITHKSLLSSSEGVFFEIKLAGDDDEWIASDFVDNVVSVDETLCGVTRVKSGVFFEVTLPRDNKLVTSVDFDVVATGRGVDDIDSASLTE